MQGVLDGVRVLDFGRFIAGPWCAALLGDFGADVIRVEKVDGGEDRFVSRISDEDGAGAMFLQVNRNKRCLTLDPTTAEGRNVQRRLIATADIVVANMPQRALQKLGLDYASLTAVRQTSFSCPTPASERRVRTGGNWDSTALRRPCAGTCTSRAGPKSR